MGQLSTKEIKLWEEERLAAIRQANKTPRLYCGCNAYFNKPRTAFVGADAVQLCQTHYDEEITYGVATAIFRNRHNRKGE